MGSDSSAYSVSKVLADPKKAVRAAAIPIAVALLIAQINSFVDAVWCAALGPSALSIIGLSAVLYLMIVGVGSGMGSGASVAVARRIGMNDKFGATQLATQAIMIIVLMAAVLTPLLLYFRIPILEAMGAGALIGTASDYVVPFFAGSIVIMFNGVIAGLLRAEGAGKKAMIVLVTGSVFNLILDPVFIFGFGMGVTGSPVATVLATGIASMVGVYWYASGRTHIRPVFNRFRFRRHLIKDIMVVGFPQSAELCIIAAMNLILNWFIIRCGGPNGLAVYSMVGIFISMATIPAAAYASALTITSTVILTQKDYKKAWFVHWRTLIFTMVVMVAIGSLVFVSAEELMVAFTYSEKTAYLKPEMVKALRIFITFTPFWILIPLGSSILQTLRMVPVSTISSSVRKLLTLAIYAVASTQSMEAMYWGYWTCEVLGGIMMYTLGLYFFSKVRRRSEAEMRLAADDYGQEPPDSPTLYRKKYVFRNRDSSAPHKNLEMVMEEVPVQTMTESNVTVMANQHIVYSFTNTSSEETDETTTLSEETEEVQESSGT